MPLRNILQYGSMASLFCHGNLILVILLLVKGLLGWLVLFEELLRYHSNSFYMPSWNLLWWTSDLFTNQLGKLCTIDSTSVAHSNGTRFAEWLSGIHISLIKHGGLFFILCWFFEWKLVAYEVDSQNSLLPLFKLWMVYEFEGFQNSGIFSYDIRDVGWTSFLRNIQITFPETIGLLCRNPIWPNLLHCFHLNLVDSREPQRARVFGNLSRWSPVHYFKS